jgi:hypothetical protein
LNHISSLFALLYFSGRGSHFFLPGGSFAPWSLYFCLLVHLGLQMCTTIPGTISGYFYVRNHKVSLFSWCKNMIYPQKYPVSIISFLIQVTTIWKPTEHFRAPCILELERALTDMQWNYFLKHLNAFLV